LKIVGIVPSTASPYLRFGIFRLGIPILLTKAKQEGHRALMVDENIEKIDLNWLGEKLREADLIFFSSLTPTYNRTLWYLNWIKKGLGLSTPIAIGGVHPTFETEKVLDDGFDFVFRREGELILTPFLRIFEDGGDFSKIPNLCYWQKGEKVFNQLSVQLPDLDKDSPFPDFLDGNLFPQWNRKRMAVIETSRSCPFRCNFCSVHPMFGPLRQRKNLEAVVEEIKRLAPGFLFFCDDYFASCKDTERSKELMSLMLRKLDRIPPWGAQVRSDVARDKEWLRLAKRSNCFFLCIGFESINPKSLKEAKKGQTVEGIENDIADFKRYGLRDALHGSFIVGFDADDKNTAMRTMEWAKEMDINTIQMGVIAPLPGTEFRENLKRDNRLLPEADNPELCDGMHALYTHQNFKSPAELQESVERAARAFSSPHDNLYVTIRGLLDWGKDWLMSFRNREMALKNFRKPYVRWRSWKVYSTIRKQTKGYLRQLKLKN